MIPVNLDMDVLRTLAVAMELGSFARAAERLGRSQSAVSLQMRKLEQQAGQPLFRKQGRGVALTGAGDVILSYARRMLELNDEAVAAVRGLAVEGSVRLGLPQDVAEARLPATLARFARAHPSVHIEVKVDRNAVLLDHLTHGRLDLALLFSRGGGAAAAPNAPRLVAQLPIAWIGPRHGGMPRSAPLPLVLFEPPCLFRQAGIAALDAAGIPWRIAFTSPSLSGLWAAVDAGLGITVRTAEGMPERLTTLAPAASGLPPLPTVDLRLHAADSEPSPAVRRLGDILAETMRTAGSGLAAQPSLLAVSSPAA
jgi:DNA-binding transcriptional LysR family regulator